MTTVNEVIREPGCPVCGEKRFAILREAYDDRYGHSPLYHITRCTSCGHVATTPSLRESELSSLYGTFYPRKLTSSQKVLQEARQSAEAARGSLGRWWAGTDNQGQYYVNPGDAVLDVGCGTCLAMLEAQSLGADVWGIDPDPNAERLGRELGLRVIAGTPGENLFPGVLFDVIVLNQVIEHLPEPDKTLRMLRARLKERGRIVAALPNRSSFWRLLSGRRWINWHVPYHLHHFNKRSIASLARRCGLQVARVRTITPNVWTVLQLQALFHHTERGRANPLWRASEESGGTCQDAVHRRRSFAAIALTLIAMFNRCVDVCGYGDSILVELKPLEN